MNQVSARLICLPRSFEELLDVVYRKFGFYPSKILTKEGAHIEEIEVIRDGDHLVVVSDVTANSNDCSILKSV